MNYIIFWPIWKLMSIIGQPSNHNAFLVLNLIMLICVDYTYMGASYISLAIYIISISPYQFPIFKKIDDWHHIIVRHFFLAKIKTRPPVILIFENPWKCQNLPRIFPFMPTHVCPPIYVIHFSSNPSLNSTYIIWFDISISKPNSITSLFSFWS